MLKHLRWSMSIPWGDAEHSSSTCLHMKVHVCLLASLLVSLLTCLLDILIACLLACLIACLLAFLLACLLASLRFVSLSSLVALAYLLCAHTHMHTCTHTHIYAARAKHALTHARARAHIQCKHARMHARTQASKHARMCTHAHTRIFVHNMSCQSKISANISSFLILSAGHQISPQKGPTPQNTLQNRVHFKHHVPSKRVNLFCLLYTNPWLSGNCAISKSAKEGHQQNKLFDTRTPNTFQEGVAKLKSVWPSRIHRPFNVSKLFCRELSAPPSHSQSLANFVANFHSQGISAAMIFFTANSFVTLNLQLFVWD